MYAQAVMKPLLKTPSEANVAALPPVFDERLERYNKLCDICQNTMSFALFAEARAILDKAVVSEPREGRAFLLRCECLYQLGDYLNAFHDAERAVYFSPNEFRGYAWRAKSLLALGEHDKAEEDWKKVQAVVGNTPEVIEALKHIFVYRFALLRIDRQEAERAWAKYGDYQKALDAFCGKTSEDELLEAEISRETVTESSIQGDSTANSNVSSPDQRPNSPCDLKANSAVWVGNVYEHISEEELLQIFGKPGRIVNYRVNYVSKYAFINYADLESAEVIVSKLNGYRYKGITFSVNGVAPERKQSYFDMVRSKTIWVGNLPPSCSTSDVTTLFSKYGNIVDCRILAEAHCGFVDYANIDEAATAMKNLTGIEFNSFLLKVKYAMDNGGMISSGTLKDPANPGKYVSLFVGNLGDTVTKSDLGTLFSKCGKIRSIRLVEKKNFAFVIYFQAIHAAKAMQMLQAYKLKGSKLCLSFNPCCEYEVRTESSPKLKERNTLAAVSQCNGVQQKKVEESRTKSEPLKKESKFSAKTDPTNPEKFTRIFIGNIDTNKTSDKQLRAVFAKVGKIAEFFTVPNRGFGFVEYTNAESATKAMQTLQHHDCCGSRLNLQFAFKDRLQPVKRGRK